MHVNLSIKQRKERNSRVATTVLVAAFLATAAMPSMAGGGGGGGGAGTAIAAGLQSLIDMLNGGVARAIAIIAVMGFGIGALSGRVDWTRALQVIIAIGILFGAATLVDMFATT